MMKKILVGIDGSARGARALHWAARRASREGANLELLSVVDSRKVKEAGASIEDVQEAVEANLDKARNFVAKRYPNVQVEMRIAEGEVVENIVDASVGCDLIVLGSHHGISVGDTIGGAKPLRVAVSAAVPTAVIPADWARTTTVKASWSESTLMDQRIRRLISRLLKQLLPSSRFV